LLDAGEINIESIKRNIKSFSISETQVNRHMLQYQMNDLTISFIRQFCAISCDLCKKESFTRINCNNTIYFCRKNTLQYLDIKFLNNLTKEETINEIEKGFGLRPHPTFPCKR
jgi:hypothetical protein